MISLTYYAKCLRTCCIYNYESMTTFITDDNIPFSKCVLLAKVFIF